MIYVGYASGGERPNSIFYPIAPALFICATVLFAVLSAIREPLQLYAAIGTILIGVFAYIFTTRTNTS